MTNREESGAAEHETFPGPGPLKTDEAKRSMRPVEQMVDAAIERIAREAESRAAGSPGLDQTPGQARGQAIAGQAITLRQADAAALMTLEEGQQARSTDRRSKGRLRWKGLEVSDDFRNYADRVARGEDLPPFAGKILAEPDPAFPWDPSSHQRAARRALKQQVGMWTGVALFLGLSVAVLVLQVRKQTEAWQTAESPLATVTMANQPTEASATPTATAEVNAPAAFNEEVPGQPGAVGEPSGNVAEGTALEGSAAANGVAAEGVEGNAGSAQPLPSTAAPLATQPLATQALANTRTAPATPSSAGVFVATRAPVTEASAAVRTAPVASAITTSEPGLRAVGTAGVPANVATGASAASAGDSASALRADPKKEPTREASAMGSLLVESPSF
ncbi:MAG: hypothetical protein RL033_2713 [Pseudomonadota bacterium]